ncbi:MAG TPA: hypothetical protein VEW67_03250 [Thermoleophilaceae bacterium]|nr:hypothetical protein [Thermoleophilaceae bacterium]
MVAAVLGGLLVAPSGALAAPALDVTLKGSYSELQILEDFGLAGTYRLRFGDGGPGVGETADIPARASRAEVESALNSISNISQGGGSVSVRGGGLSSEGLNVLYGVSFDGGPLEGKDVPVLEVLDGMIASPYPGPVRVRTVQRAGMRRDDAGIQYVATVRNLARSVPAVGDEVFCNGIEAASGPSKNWGPGVPGDPTHPSYAFEWRRNGVVIAGAVAQSYTTTSDDAGKVLQCLVTGTNATSGAAYASMPGMVVDPQPATPPPAPSDRINAGSRPAVLDTDGASRTGTETGVCHPPANWSGVTEPYAFQWLRNGQEIAGATTNTYVPQGGVGEPDQNKVLQCRVIGSNAGGALVGISNNSVVGTVASQVILPVAQNPSVEFANTTSSPVTLEIELPEGRGAAVLNIYNPDNPQNPPVGWACSSTFATASDPAKVTCTRSDALAPGQQFPPVAVGVGLSDDMPNVVGVRATVSGGGDPDGGVEVDEFDFSQPSLGFGLIPESMETNLFDEDGGEYTRAGGHPWAAYAQIHLNHRRTRNGEPLGRLIAVERAKQLLTDTPPGLVGNPLAPLVVCDDAKKTLKPAGTPGGCPLESIVGEVRLGGAFGNPAAGGGWGLQPLYAIEAERGVAAQFALGINDSKGIYVLNARLRPEDGYAVSIDSAPIVEVPPLDALGATLCSYGANTVPAGLSRLLAGCKQPGEAGAFEKPLFTNPTACTTEPLQTRMSADSWEHPGVFSSVAIDEPLMTDCETVPFTPSTTTALTSPVRDAASGFELSLSVPSDGLEDPDGISQAHLKKTVVELPEGVAVNPSGATGLAGCSDAQLGLKTDSEPSCPDGSKIGTATATTPVLEETLSGTLVLRTPKSTDPMSGEMLRMALILRNVERGILVKLPGSATADPQTGKLTATFDDNPQLPIGDVSVTLKGGDRGMLAMPQTCGPRSIATTLSPWSGTAPVTQSSESDVSGDCGFGFSPGLQGGMSNPGAREGGTFAFEFTRPQGDQWVKGLTAQLPTGLLAKVKDVALCQDAQAAAGNCPAGSRIGSVDASAGSGDPFVLEQKGDVYLTEGYKGGAYGLMVKVRAIAGPFRGDMELSPIIVRQAIHVDRKTAQVSAVSDPFPTIHHGVPLRVRRVLVNVDRTGFMLNPSDCDAKQVAADLTSAEGTTVNRTTAFQARDCRNLAFKPKLAMRLTGRKQVTTGKHPGIKAVVTQQGTSEAGIEKAVVRLPKSLALDPDNAQALCEFADGTKPDLENHCPKGSIVGRARASTPLLDDDLAGNVYFVKNIRKDPVTGNEIRTLPMIMVALRGEIAVNLKGESSTTKSGKLVNTFNAVPDAPISQFNLNIKGGKTGIIAVTRTRRAKINLCTARHIAETDMDAHNGRQHDTDVRMKTPCSKKQTKAAKRQAKRAAAKASR